MHIIFVLPNTATQIIGYADIERSIFLACHDIDVVGFQYGLLIPRVIPV